jgi:hypothetical protein
VVRILKDLDRDITGRHVVIVEDIVDSGLTLSWLMKYLQSAAAEERRGGRAVPQARRDQGAGADKYVGFDIPSEFVVGYGLDFAERYARCRPSGCIKARGVRPVAERLSRASPRARHRACCASVARRRAGGRGRVRVDQS